MRFSEKIDKILKAKDIALWKLAELGGIKKSTLEKAYERNGEMREKIMRDFLQKLGINIEWWRTGNGEMFSNEPQKVEAPSDDVDYILPLGAWQRLEKQSDEIIATNVQQRIEINKLFDLIDYFRSHAAANK